MIGIVLLSHGRMAEGMLDSARLFYGDELPQLTWASLTLDMAADVFQDEIKARIQQVDAGDGVLILTDLLGGTPCNLAGLMISDQIQVVSGMNLGMLLEVLGRRESGDLTMAELAEIGRNGIVVLNDLLD